jgi:hypothetical protein
MSDYCRYCDSDLIEERVADIKRTNIGIYNNTTFYEIYNFPSCPLTCLMASYFPKLL